MTTPEREKLQEALKAIEYKYFGDYPLSETQWGALNTLTAFAQAGLSAAPTHREWPTDVMIEVGANVLAGAGRCDTWDKGSEVARRVYKSMTEHAPTPPVGEPVYQHYADWHGAGTWVDIGDLRFEALKANGVKTRILYTSPPFPKADESEAVAWINFTQSAYAPLDLHFQFSNPHDDRWTPVFTSPPSPPKAEYDAEGNPLNLLAAAKIAADYISFDRSLSRKEQRTVNILRKFIGEGS